MKRYIFLGCLCAALTFTSCDNYLDVIPKGKSVLHTTSDYLGLIEQMDVIYPADEFNYLANISTFQSQSSLESYSYPLISSSYLWDENQDRTQYLDDSSSESMLYSACYKRISNYNIIIDNIGDADGPQSDKVLGIAQAKIMRAYNYFFLINTFAKPYDPATAETDNGIILHTKFDLESSDPQRSVADVYGFIQQDIIDAINDLPEKALNNYRPDKAFGYALKAKVHLYKREFGLALEAALEALKQGNHQLLDMPGWFTSDKASFEATYPGMNLDDPTDMMYRSAWSMFHMSYLQFRYDHPEHLLFQTQRPPSVAMLNKATIDLYDKNNDIRYVGVLAFYMGSRPTAEAGNITFMSPTTIELNTAGMRLSEVYLIIAECYARDGKIDLAMKYLNDLRVKRILPAGYTELTTADVHNDKTEALSLIREERKRELAFSYDGFFDMRRFMTEFNETMTKVYTNTKGESKTLTLKPGSHLLTFPFPIKAMQTSNLVQNSK